MSERRPLRILVLTPEYTPEVSGGVGTHAFEITQGLARAGHRVWVLAYTTASDRVVDGERFTAHLMAPKRSAAPASSMVGQILEFNGELVERAHTLFRAVPPPDVVQSYNWVTFRAARTLGDEWGVPVVSSIHYMSEPLERWWGQTPDPEIVAEEANMCRGADAWVAVSESLRRVVAETHAMPVQAIDVVHNALDADAFAPRLTSARREQLRARLAPGRKRIALFAGRLSPTKGILPLIQSAGQFAATRDDVAYVVAGDADSRDFGALVRESVTRCPALTGRMKFVGKVPRAQLPLLYAAADLAIVPSVYESFGYAAVEAMACGVPVVASATGGLAEIVEDGRSGLLVPMHETGDATRSIDVDALTSAQRRLLDAPEYARQVGEAGLARVRAHFNIETMVARTVGVYACAMRNAPSRVS